jgi:hypothetical protein
VGWGEALSEHTDTQSRGFNGLSILGWVLGGLSVLNLIHDLSPVKLYGLVKDWAAGYEALVEKIAGVLFGWIDWRWIKIDTNEVHLIVLSILLGSATLRASMQEQIKHGQKPFVAFIGALEGALVAVVLPVVFAVALLPGMFGILAAAAFLVWATYEFGFRNLDADEFVPASKDVRREFVGILAVFALLIAFNYALSFKA